MNKSIDQLIIQMLLFDGNESNLLDDIDSYTNFRRDIHDKRSDLLRKENIMSWNYRVVKHDCEEDYYEIMEVYYDKNGNINGYADAGCPYGESIEEIRECLKLMSRALDKPILQMKDIKGG